MIKTLKQTISNMFYWIKKKLVQFKRWLVILIFGAAVVAAPLVLPNVPDVALEKIQQKYEKSELKGKYRLEKTAFILDAVDENAIQAEVGNKNSDSFEPSLTLRKWNDEVNFKVKYKHAEKEKDQKVDIENKKIKWKGKKTEVHYYEMKKGEVLLGEELESDVYEVEVILLEKPDTNIVSFDIETQGLSFFYQPELTQKEKDEGCHRPENVIGSYAVYHESKAGDYSKMGLKNYRAGKAFHIYRPKIIDNAGKEVWGKLNITDNLLTVEIPQKFLDNAVYPIRHAAGLTFGWTGAGGTQDGDTDRIKGSVFAGAAGTGISITAYTVTLGGTPSRKCALYKHSDSGLVDNGSTEEKTSANNPAAWETYNFGISPTLTAQDYVICNWGTGGFLLGTTLYYDTGDANQGHYDDLDYSNNSGNFPATASFTHTTRKYSIYCTYTAGGAAERRMFLTQ